MVDAHVAHARRAHELPHAGRADLRVACGIERRLDVRQSRELERQAARREHLLDVGLPRAGADQSRAEPIRLTELKAQPPRGGAKLGAARAFGEQLQDALFLVVQSFACAARELREDVASRLLRALDTPAPLARAQVLGNAHRLKDEVHAQRVVDETLARVDLGVDAGPERDRRLETRGPREEVVLGAGVKGEEDEGVGYRRAICDAHLVASGSSELKFLDYVHRAHRPSRTQFTSEIAERGRPLPVFLFVSIGLRAETTALPARRQSLCLKRSCTWAPNPARARRCAILEPPRAVAPRWVEPTICGDILEGRRHECRRGIERRCGER